MASKLNHTPLVLALLVACGPGTNTTDTSSDTEHTDNTNSGTGTGTTAPTTGTSDTPTGDASTVDPTVDPTADPTATGTGTSTTVDPTDATTGGVDCSQVLPEDGKPCANEGLVCGGPCDDPCSFCNISKCEDGTWMQLEVFPAPCLDCESICNLVVPAACEAGPTMHDDCVTGCMATQNGECGLTYNNSLACIGDMPTFTCDGEGHPIVAGCEREFAALYECIG